MNELIKRQMLYIEQGGAVQRMHTVPTLQPQSVAAHSFGVAWWCWLLSPGNKPSANLLLAALEHDLPEGSTGDIPSPTKANLGPEGRGRLANLEAAISLAAGMPVFEITEGEAHILRLADLLELMQHCIRERTMGNRSVQLTKMFNNVYNSAMQLYKKGGIQSVTDAHGQIVYALTREWNSL